MNHQYIRLRATLVILFSLILLAPSPARATSLPMLGGHNASSVQSNSKAFRLEIPSIKISLPIVTARFKDGTWDFSRIYNQAGYFEGTPLPGVGGNLVIGAHSEFAYRVRGPFYHLSDIQVGAQIIVTYQGQPYTYQVATIWSVDPSDVSPIYNSSGDVLTLMTCSGYSRGVYETRLIVRATRVK